MQVTLTIPDTLGLGDDPEEVGRHLLRMAALLMFRAGDLSIGAASELAGVDRFTFAAECERHGIPVVDYPPGELLIEVQSILSKRANHLPGNTDG